MGDNGALKAVGKPRHNKRQGQIAQGGKQQKRSDRAVKILFVKPRQHVPKADQKKENKTERR